MILCFTFQIWPEEAGKPRHGCCNSRLFYMTGVLPASWDPHTGKWDILGLSARPCPQSQAFMRETNGSLPSMAHLADSFLPPCPRHQDTASNVSISRGLLHGWHLVDFPIFTCYHSGLFLKGTPLGHKIKRENCFFLPFWIWVMIDSFSWSLCGDRFCRKNLNLMRSSWTLWLHSVCSLWQKRFRETGLKRLCDFEQAT